LVWEKAPFFALTAGSSLITYLVQNRAGAMWTLAEVPLPARIGNALVSYWRYLAKSFWPVRLSIFYPHPGEWSMGVVLAAGLALVAVTVIVFRLRRRAPFMLVGWLWFLGMLVPVIGLVQVGWQSLADRYMYLPMIGLLVVVVWGTESLARERLASIGPLRAIGAGLVGVSALLTWQQLGYWKNSESLFGHAVSVTQNNFVAHHNLGMALMARGQLEPARQEFREAVRLRPRSADSYNGLGEVLLRQGRLDEGQTLFEQAIALKPDLAVAHNNLGIILSRKRSPDAAAAQFEAAIKARPGYTKAFINLALALQASGRLEEATQKLQRAVELAPEDAEARKNLGMALGRSGRLEEAVQQLGIALKINPDDSQACHNLGLACLRLGRAPEAIAQFERALKLKADSAETHAYLGMALAQVNRQAEAADHVREALKLKPNDPQLEQQLRTLTGEARH
jgi:Flp pilus assembly protein TadD